MKKEIIISGDDRNIPEKLAPDLDTLAKYFVASAERFSSAIAMRKKRFGIWQEYTWAQSYQHVHDFSLGLLALGIKRGDKMAIIGENDPEYYLAEIAGHAAGVVTVGIFTDATAKEIGYVVNNSDSVLIVAHDQEQCDKILEIRDELPNLIKVVYWEERGLWDYDDPWLISFESVEKLGRDYAKEHPGAFLESVKAGHADDLAIFSYTSGTTSLPKGVMISHRNLIYGIHHVSRVHSLDPQDDYVSFSPMAWIAEQGFGVTDHVKTGITVNFPEKPETVQMDIREIAPVELLIPSRLWESLVSQVQARIADADWLNRALYDYFMPIAYKIANLQDEGKQPGLYLRLMYFLGNLTVYAPLRDKVGLRRIKYAYTGGAALSPDVLRFFRAINIELLQLYGSTECQTHTIHYVGDVRLGTVGKPAPGVQIKITEDGEIAVRSRSVFEGYYKQPDKTEEVLIDGWFHTGDAGYVDENGHVIYLDRLSDMISLSTEDRFSPQYIEGRIKFNPHIQDVMAVGSTDMPYVSTLVTINFDNVARWAEKRGISFTTIVDLSQKPEVYDLVEKEIQRVNATLPPKSQVRKFVILNKTFDADEAELTRTRKLRRRYLEQRYGDILTAIYGGKDSITIQSEVTYQDGRTATTEIELAIRSVGDSSDLPVIRFDQETVAK